jgi:hypothetical protein
VRLGEWWLGTPVAKTRREDFATSLDVCSGPTSVCWSSAAGAPPRALETKSAERAGGQGGSRVGHGGAPCARECAAALQKEAGHMVDAKWSPEAAERAGLSPEDAARLAQLFGAYYEQSQTAVRRAFEDELQAMGREWAGAAPRVEAALAKEGIDVADIHAAVRELAEAIDPLDAGARAERWAALEAKYGEAIRRALGSAPGHPEPQGGAR